MTPLEEATIFTEGVLWGLERERRAINVAWLWSQVTQAALAAMLDWTLINEFSCSLQETLQNPHWWGHGFNA